MPSFSFSGGVEVLGFISPTDTNDTYPVIDPLYGIDGLRNVNTITELNSITNQRRRPGMVVGVNDGSIYYKLNSPPWNGSLSDWSIFQSGGGGGTFTGGTISGDTIFTQGVTATTLNVNGVSITGDTYTTGGTYSSGILNFNYNTGGGYQISGLDTANTYITGFTYDNINTFSIDDNSGNTFSSSINVLSATTISGGTFYGDGSNLTNTPDKYITDLSFNNSNYNLTVTRNDLWSDTVSLSILSSDMTITGGTYNPGTGVATFTNNSGGTFNVSGFLVGYTDHYVTGYTYDNSNTFNIFDNSGNTFSASINTMTGLTVSGQTTLVQPQSSDYLVFSSSTLTNSGQTMYIRQTASNQYVFGSTGIGNFMRVGPTNIVDFEGQRVQSLLRGAQFGSSLSNPVQIPYAINISTLPSQSTGTTSNVDAIRINPSITTTSTYTGTYRGIYYNPTVSITTGTTHLAIETVRGDVLFGTTSGNVGVGTTNPTTKLHVAGTSLMSAATQNVLTVIGSGNTSSPPIFSVQGSNGELFSVNDSLIGSLFSVNDISGIPIFEVFSDNTILMGSYLAPSLNTTVRVLPSVGTTNVYSLPLSAYTGAWFEYTVKSTTGARSGQIMSIFSGTTVNITETTTTSIGVTTPITFNMISDGTNATLRVSVISGTWEVRVIIRSI